MCTTHNTLTLKPVSNGLPSNDGHVNHISLGAGISGDHTPIQLKKTKEKIVGASEENRKTVEE